MIKKPDLIGKKARVWFYDPKDNYANKLPFKYEGAIIEFTDVNIIIDDVLEGILSLPLQHCKVEVKDA